jgi:hypothetical protein
MFRLAVLSGENLEAAVPIYEARVESEPRKRKTPALRLPQVDGLDPVRQFAVFA